MTIQKLVQSFDMRYTYRNTLQHCNRNANMAKWKTRWTI